MFFYVSVLNAVFYADAPTSHHALSCVPADSPSRGGDAAVYVFITETNRACSLLFYSILVFISVFTALSTVIHSIHFPDNSPLSRSVLLVLFLHYWSFHLYIYLFMKVSFSSDVILCG